MSWLSRWRDGGRSGQGTVHVSLGTFCHAAAALRDCGLRRWTGPFDWIFTDPAMVTECLRDDFAALLDRRELRSVPAGELTGGARRQCRHPRFEDRYNLPTLFNHHDPAGNESDRRSVARAIDRFRAALAAAAPLRFYLASQREWPDADVEDLRRALARLARDATLVVATIEPGSAEPGWTLGARPGGTVDLRVRTRTRSLGAKFPDPRDDALLADALLGAGGRAA